MKRDLIRLSMMGWTLIACAVFNPRSTPAPPATAVAAVTKTAPIRFTLPPPKTATPTATFTSTSTPTSTFTPTTTFTSTRILTATRTPTPTRTIKASATSTFTATPKTSITYKFDSGVSSSLQTNIKTGGDTADKYFRIIGGDASAKVTVYAYNDFNALVKAEIDFYKLYGSTSSEDFVRSNWTAQVCGHGNIAVIFLPVSTTTCWDGEKTTTYTIVSHEYFHAQQGNLSGKRFAVDDPHAEVPSTGPVWLTEGSAEYFAHRALSNSKLINYSDKRKTILSRASRLSVSLSDLETHQDFVSYADEGSYQLGFLAVEYLVTSKGDGSLLKFYKAIGGGTTWKTAFSDAFGKSIDDFYKSFEAYRKTNFAPAPVGKVIGNVTDSKGKAMSLVYVWFCPTTSVWCEATTTDFDGTYEATIPVGTYTIWFSPDEDLNRGWGGYVNNTTLSTNRALVKQFKLEKDGTLTVDVMIK